MSGHPLRSSPRIEAARCFAIEAHRGQPRRGTRFPYIVHPLEAARAIAACYADEDLVVAALLHDTIEDTAITAAQIETRFGPRVARLVVAVTAVRGTNWRDTRAATLAKLLTAEPDALRLKVADGLSNVRSITRDVRKLGRPSAFAKFRAATSDDIAWYHRGICAAARARLGAEPLLEQYSAAIAELWPDEG
jgi:myo-inositol-1(or 4)-monophosphatase